ncbi:MAG: 16S rRNA (cytidine(1402)-2'-O)-methyltransferase [Clostridia bacterium]|nr:16S rRNA (cytidine(1402)-2'-O)-methyltransferase [Clostridia bacterium]
MYTTGEKNAIVGGTLYLVATPIGNLADLSERALKVLSEVDFVAAEDTRNSGLLLSRFGISKPLISYFEHNKRERGGIIADRLEKGESCALITDAGTPAISDPGEDIVRLCAERGIPVTSIPGACAAITALTLSGLATGRFTFEGFLSGNKTDRRERFAELAEERRTMIFYEAPHHLRQTLADFLTHFGDRKITLCRELTKLNEEVFRTTVSQAIEEYKTRDPRGEYVLVVEGFTALSGVQDYPEDIAEHVAAFEAEGMSRMEAIKACAKKRGVPKSVVYDAVNK